MGAAGGLPAARVAALEQQLADAARRLAHGDRAAHEVRAPGLCPRLHNVDVPFSSRICGAPPGFF